MYKIIACDLDETLLSDDRSISKENIEAIQKAKELGVKFVPATGRGYNTVDGTLKELGLYDLENEYVISTAASLGVMIGIVFAIFLDFPVEYGISLGLLNGIVLGSLISYKNNKN